MTNKEVINFLNQVRKIILDDKSWLESTIQPINEAFDMAINALTVQPETHDKRTETHACDLINRQQAIDAVKDLPNCRNGFSDTYDKACIIGVLEDLPAAQPQWIPFSKMMPAFGESVLVQFDDDDMDVLTFPNIYKRLKRVAWMPLPKPYGGDTK